VPDLLVLSLSKNCKVACLSMRYAVSRLRFPSARYVYSINITRRTHGTIGADADEVADLLDRTVVKGSKFTDRPAVLTTRREALSLYREILRWSNLFVWRDQQGRLFKDLIRESARKEFEDARYERDPEIVSRLLVTGRDCVQKTVERVLQQREVLMQQDQQQPGTGMPPGQ
jgi:hypothetical protein